MTLTDARRGLGRTTILDAGRRALRRSCHGYAIRQHDSWREDDWYAQSAAILERHLGALLAIARRWRADPDRADDELIDLVCTRCECMSGEGPPAPRELDCCALYSVLSPLVRALAEVLGQAPSPRRLVDRPSRR